MADYIVILYYLGVPFAGMAFCEFLKWLGLFRGIAASELPMHLKVTPASSLPT